MASLNNRVALVTGGSRGIGQAIAISLAEAGAAIAVNYREKAAEARNVAETIRRAGGRAMALGADVSRAAEVAAMVAAVERELGPIDILVNNAGIGLVRTVDELTEEDFDRTIAVNLKSVFLCTQAVVAGMRARQWGRIVNISSGAARGAGGVGPHYNASKAGMEGMTRGYGRHHGECRGAVADRDRHGPLRSCRLAGADSAGTLRHARGMRPGRADGDRQCVYDGTDDCLERRHVVRMMP